MPNNNPKKQTHPLLITGMLLIVSLSLRYMVIGKGFYHTDNLFLSIQAAKILATGQMHYLHLVGYPLTGLLGALFLKIGQLLGVTNPALSINSLSAVFSSLSIVLYYLVVKRIADRTVALCSAGLVMVHPLFWAASVFGNSHMPSLFFFFASLYLLLKYIDHDRYVFLWFSASSAGLMLAARPQNTILLFLLSYVILARTLPGPGTPKSRSRIQDVTVFFLILSLIFVFFYLPMLHTHQRIVIDDGTLGTLSEEVFTDWAAFALPISLKHTLFTFTPWGIGLILLGLTFVLIKSRALFGLILVWALPSWLLFGGLVTYVPRYSLSSVFALTIAIAFFLSFLIKKNRYLAVMGGIVYALLIMLWVTSIYNVLLFRHQNDRMQDFGLWVKEHTAPQAVIYCQDESIIIRHYAGREVKKPPFVKYAGRAYQRADLERLSGVINDLKGMLKAGTPVYITHSALTAYDPENRFLKTLQNSFRLESLGGTVLEEWHQGITRLLLYREELYRIRIR